MDRHDISIKEELGNLISSLQKLLPKKKDIIVLEPTKPTLTRLRDVNVEAKNVFPQCFTGARLVIQSQMLDKVKLVQRYNFGNSKKSHRSFLNFLHQELAPKHVDDGVLIDTSGSAIATYTETTDDFNLRLTSKIKNLVSSENEVMVEKSDEKYVGSVSCIIDNVNPCTMKFVTQYMHKIMPEFSLGGEVGLQPFSHPTMPIFSIISRYDSELFTLTSTVARTGIQFCFFKQFSPGLRIASIISETPVSPASVSLALHKNYENGSELKIFVDSKCCGGFTFQKDVLFYEPHNETRVLRLMVSTLIDRRRKIRFGFGFNLDF